MLTDEHIMARVASRFIEGKAKGKSLMPAYEKALAALEKGEQDLMEAFTLSTARIILPVAGGVLPDWFSALGTVKRNAIMGLYKEFGRFARARESMLANTSIEKERMNGVLLSIAKDWAKGIRTLEIASAVTDATLEVQHGPFVVIAVPGVTKRLVDESLSALDVATAKIRSKCPRVLYGKLFLSTTLKKGIAARYVYDHDALYLNVSAKKRFDDVFTIIHELGHRHDNKFLSKAGRDKFWSLSTRTVHETLHFDAKLREQMADEVVAMGKLKALGRPLPAMSDELGRWLRSPHPHTRGDISKLMTQFLKGAVDEKALHSAAKGTADADVMTDKVLHGPLHVTPYGGTKPAENYADGFAHFILGMDMPPELAAILADEVK